METTVDRAAPGSVHVPRALLGVLLAWWTLRVGIAGAGWCFVDYVNLAFHEAGHLFLAFAGSTLHYLGGTLGQLAVPVALGAVFLVHHGRPSSSAVCVWWLGESLVNVSVYMADARELALPLVGGGDHDWNELFFRWGLLGESSVATVAGATRVLGVAAMLIGLAWWSLFVVPGLRDRLSARLTIAAPRLVPLLHDD